MLRKNEIKAFKAHPFSQMKQSFSRAKQATGEKTIGTDKTSYDSMLALKIQKADSTEKHTKKIIEYATKVIEAGQENDKLYDVKSRFNQAAVKPNKHETFGNCLLDASNEMMFSDYGKDLRLLGDAEKQIALCEREFIKESSIVFVEPLNSFLSGELAAIQRETKLLDTKRLDLDVSKHRLSKLKNDAPRLDAEAEVEKATRQFEQQCELVSDSIDGLQDTCAKQSEHLKSFIQAQFSYHAKCAQIIKDIASQLN